MVTLNRRVRGFAVVTALTLFLVVGLSLVALFAGAPRAQASLPDAPARSSARQAQGTPPAPPPLNPPITTPEPGQAANVRASPNGSTVEVIPFQSKLRFTRGQLAALVQGSDIKVAPTSQPGNWRKPAGQSHGPQTPYQPPDYPGLFSPLSWNPLFYEGFEVTTISNTTWILEDFGNDGFDRQWDTNTFLYQLDARSAWPAAGGADGLDPNLYYYTDNLDSWMEQEFDFSGLSDVFVSFGLWYNTEPQFDWVYFCVSVDFSNYNCDYWSGQSGGWIDQAYWLTSYAGYSTVWLAWVFRSDGSVSAGYDGPFVDEIYVYGNDAAATPPPTPDPNGQLIQNGSFETGDLSNWNTYNLSSPNLEGNAGQPPAPQSEMTRNAGAGEALLPAATDAVTVTVTTVTWVEGSYSAVMEGSGFLYQSFTVPSGATDITLDYWFAVTGFETASGYDLFCVSLRPGGSLSTITVDLGCVDAITATGYWQEVVFTLSASQVAAVSALASPTIVFELYNDPTAPSFGWVDYVRVYATGGSGGAYLDSNEPNDTAATATTLACGATNPNGVVGDALGGYDVDWFRLNNVPAGPLTIDIDAQTKVPPSSLDSVVRLYDSSGTNQVAFNDDDGVTFDSFISYTVPITNSTYYLSVEPYSGYGSADAFYDLTANCEGTGGPPPEGGGETPPPQDTWTVMLYLNAEDAGFESVLTQYRTSIESFIGSKSSFLKVVILYDGPQNSALGNSGTTRYLVQPNGAYTDNVNRWALGELNMGDPTTLADFVNWAMDQYPAENYYLAIDDHGDGAYGISVDATSQYDQLTPTELYEAIKTATRQGVRKLDILDYEACLMGIAENAYDMREWVEYVVFSEQISWGINTYPVYFSDLAATDTPLVVGQRIVNRYHAGANTAGYPHTISLIDTSQMAAVRDAVTNLGNVLRSGSYTTATVNAARNAAQAFAADREATNYALADYVDLWDLADEAGSRGLAVAQAAAVKAAVDAAVVAEQHSSGGIVVGPSLYIWNHSGAHGLSIYYPANRLSGAFNDYVAPNLYQMSDDGTWDEFLNWAVSSATGDRGGMSVSRYESKFTPTASFVYRYVYLPVARR